MAKTDFISWGIYFPIFVPKFFENRQENLEKYFFFCIFYRFLDFFQIFVPKFTKFLGAVFEKFKKMYLFEQFFEIFTKLKIFTKKTATSPSSPYGGLTLCQVSEKSLERILRKAVPYVRTYGRTNKTDFISPFGFQPGTNNMNKQGLTRSPVVNNK